MFSQIIYALLCSVPWGKNYNSWDLKKAKTSTMSCDFPDGAVDRISHTLGTTVCSLMVWGMKMLLRPLAKLPEWKGPYFKNRPRRWLRSEPLQAPVMHASYPICTKTC